MDGRGMKLVQSRIDRQKAFFESGRPGLLTLFAYPFDPAAPVKLPIDQIDWADEVSVDRFAASQFRQFDVLNRRHDKPEDDYIPWMGIQVGTGSIGASYLRDWASLQMHYEGMTDWMDPPVKDWGDLDRIGFNPDNPCFRALLQVTRYLANRFDGSYGLRNYPHFNALDLANQLRGNELFMDLYDSPDNVREMLRRGNAAVREMETFIRDKVITPSGCYGAVCGVYIESGMYLSCDAGDMVGPDLLREFGFEETQELCSTLGGAFLHHHEMGMNTLPVWAEASGLRIQHLMRDPNTAHLEDGVDESVLAASMNVPVLFNTTFEKYRKHASDWAHGRFAVQVELQDEAQECEARRLADKHHTF